MTDVFGELMLVYKSYVERRLPHSCDFKVLYVIVTQADRGAILDVKGGLVEGEIADIKRYVALIVLGRRY